MERLVICVSVDRRRCPHFVSVCFLWIRGTRPSLVFSQYFLLCYHGTGLHWYYYKDFVEAFCHVRAELFFSSIDYCGGSYFLFFLFVFLLQMVD